jgi:hypothetical protein
MPSEQCLDVHHKSVVIPSILLVWHNIYWKWNEILLVKRHESKSYSFQLIAHWLLLIKRNNWTLFTLVDDHHRCVLDREQGTGFTAKLFIWASVRNKTAMQFRWCILRSVVCRGPYAWTLLLVVRFSSRVVHSGLQKPFLKSVTVSIG